MEEEITDSEYPQDFTKNIKLHRAAKKGQVGRLKRLCKSGINPDAVNEQHQNPLFLAALHGRVKAVEFLLASGANPNHACYDGSTPMHAACLACCPHIVCLLADAGGNISHHDNRGLLPRDWVSYQENIERRFKMRKFLEAMRLFSVGTSAAGDRRLMDMVATGSRWTALADYVRRLPAHSQRRWRRRRWFRESSPRRRFRSPTRPRWMSNFSRSIQAFAASCWRSMRHPFQTQDISQRDTLPSQSVTKQAAQAGKGVLVNPNYCDEQIEVDGCKCQLSDTKYPIQTLYVDEKLGKLSSSKLAEDGIRQPDLSEIKEEGSFQSSLNGSCPQREAVTSIAGATKRGETFLLCSDCKGNGQVKKEVTCQIQPSGKSEGSQRASEAVEENGNDEDFVHRSSQPQSTEACPRMKASDVLDADRKQGSIKDERKEEEGGQKQQKETSAADDQDECDQGSNSVSSNDSCRNQLMEILEDAFKMELAPGVSKLMAEYCDSTQGSTAAGESFDIDFHSYHGDDNEEAAEDVNWIGPVDDALSCSSSDDLNNNLKAKDVNDPRNLSPGEVIRSSDAILQAEMEIDQLILESSGEDSSEDEAQRNFIQEGRYVDVQKMLSDTFEMVFGDKPSRKDDKMSLHEKPNGNDENVVVSRKNEQASRKQYPSRIEVKEEEGNDSISTGNGSSLYRVSAMDESALISNLSMEVNVTESNKSSLDSFLTPDLEDGGSSSRTKEVTDEEGGITLHSALTQMDLTAEEMHEVKEWFGGHGSVRNLIREYEDKIRQLAGDNPLRPTIMSLRQLLRKEYGGEQQRATKEEKDAVVTKDDREAPCEGACIDAEVLDDRTASDATQQQTVGLPETCDITSANKSISATMETPQVSVTTERSYDESWLWPGSGDEEETFEEQLRRSMDSMGILPDDSEDDDDEKQPRESGDAQILTKEEDNTSPMVSPPPPTCTPEGESSPHPSPVEQADSSISSRVNNSGDCEPPTTASIITPVSKDEAPKENAPLPDSPARKPPVLGHDGELSPPSEATRKLVQIDVMRSPTVEAIYITSV